MSGERDRAEGAPAETVGAEGAAEYVPVSPEAAGVLVGEEADEHGATSSDDAAMAARVLAEHNALANVFDDVRQQSAVSALVQPTRWEARGLVPEHLDPEEFEMLVYEYLEEAQAAYAETEAAEAPVYRTATRAVGVPQFGKKKFVEAEGEGKGDDAAALREALGEEALDSDSFRDDGGDDFATGESDSPSLLLEQSERVPAAGGGTDCAVSSGAENSDSACFDPANPFANLNIPEGFKLVELEGEYVLVPDEDAEPIERTIDCAKVVALVGAHSYYLYDRSVMTDSYAHWAFLAAEDNRTVTFVDCVREDSRVYPRPLAASSLENEPFSMDAREVTRIWDTVRESGEYPDIGQTTASNGDVYYFSTNYLSEVYAASLAEWDAVERDMNR
ncbi:MAG: hypothetical protein RSN88_03435 [Gordonibacter sp.]|uniref:hypothetical protein n=1 Tax=Gordonibacter sp. TaxID=1968902 RepID=UPI002FC8778B